MKEMDIIHRVPSMKVEDHETSSSPTGYAKTSDMTPPVFSPPVFKDCIPAPIPAWHGSRSQAQVSHGCDAWSPMDAHFAQLFNYWESLPLSPDASWEEKLAVLQVLESIIVPFERAIGNFDEGFAVWRARHQAAMENGLSPIPDWPKLRNVDKVWLNEKWNERYRYLVNQRKKLLAWRLRDLNAGRLYRGLPASRPHRITKGGVRNDRDCTNNSIPQLWAQSMTDRLTVEAKRRKTEAQTVINTFWTDPPPHAVPAFTMSSGSNFSSPPSAHIAPPYGQLRTRCETPTPTAGTQKVHPEVIKIESDSE